MSDPKPTASSKDTTRVIVAAVAVIAILWFAIANRQRVNISWWFFGDRQSRLIYVIIVSAILGAIGDRLFLSRRKKG